jgi:hypothetical protein
VGADWVTCTRPGLNCEGLSLLGIVFLDAGLRTGGQSPRLATHSNLVRIAAATRIINTWPNGQPRNSLSKWQWGNGGTSPAHDSCQPPDRRDPRLPGRRSAHLCCDRGDRSGPKHGPHALGPRGDGGPRCIVRPDRLSCGIGCCRMAAPEGIARDGSGLDRPRRRSSADRFGGSPCRERWQSGRQFVGGRPGGLQLAGDLPRIGAHTVVHLAEAITGGKSRASRVCGASSSQPSQPARAAGRSAGAAWATNPGR